MDEIRCIYCNSKDNISVSDIIPDSITTAKCTNKNVCKKCNNLTNTEFEIKFAKLFAFFRNQLGYRNRRNNKAIPYEVGFYINRMPKPNSKPDYTKTFTTLKEFYSRNFVIDESGVMIGLKNAPNKFTKLIKPQVGYNHTINYKELFLSIITLRTVAKICYEWHCKKNKVYGYNEKRYQRITNYINGKNKGKSPIEIIDDNMFEMHTVHMLGYVDGSHALLEYIENGKRTVLFSLFGSIWYKVNICEDFTSSERLEELEQYSLDKAIRINKSNGIAIDYNKNDFSIINKIVNYFEKPKTIQLSKIEKGTIIKCINKLEYLLKSFIVTYQEIERQLSILEKENFINESIFYYYDLINYKENRKILIIILMYVIDELGWKKEENIKNTLIVWYKKVITYSQDETTLLNFWNKNVNSNSFNEFKKRVSNGANIFRTIPPQ